MDLLNDEIRQIEKFYLTHLYWGTKLPNSAGYFLETLPSIWFSLTFSNLGQKTKERIRQTAPKFRRRKEGDHLKSQRIEPHVGAQGYFLNLLNSIDLSRAGIAKNRQVHDLNIN